MTKIKPGSEWNQFIARANNFHWNSSDIEQQLVCYEPLCKKIYDANRHLLTTADNLDYQKKKTLLNSLFAEAYTSISMADYRFTYFLKGAPLYNNAYEACFFTSLCIFLHETIRAESKTLKEFVYNNSLDYYNENGSKNYCPFDNPSELLLNDVKTLRKQRHRLLSSRPVYNKRGEWSAMAKDSEHEWSFKYTLEVENDLSDTFKRIGNLYKDINAVLALPQNNGFEEMIKKAYKRFLSKLENIKYENFLNLQKEILEHICESKKFYGINLYRIEKELRPYITTTEVNQLLAYETVADEEAALNKSAILNGICFPKVYNDLVSLAFISDIENHSLYFLALCQFIIPVNCLLIDELIENNRLGEDWYDFLCQVINELAEEVLYNPKDIDYTVTSKSQEKFMKILSAATEREIYKRTNIIIS